MNTKTYNRDLYIWKKRPTKETYRLSDLKPQALQICWKKNLNISTKRPAIETNWPCLISGTKQMSKATCISGKRPTKETYWFSVISGTIPTSKETYMYEKRPIQQSTDALSLHTSDTIYMSKETCQKRHVKRGIYVWKKTYTADAFSLLTSDTTYMSKETWPIPSLSLQTSDTKSKETCMFFKNPVKQTCIYLNNL